MPPKPSNLIPENPTTVFKCSDHQGGSEASQALQLDPSEPYKIFLNAPTTKGAQRPPKPSNLIPENSTTVLNAPTTKGPQRPPKPSNLIPVNPTTVFKCSDHQGSSEASQALQLDPSEPYNSF